MREQKQLSLLLDELKKAGDKGIRSIDIVCDLGILNFKGRIFDLRRGRLNNENYDIECLKVEGNIYKYVYKGIRSSVPFQLSLFPQEA
jgi:hypothetical protein